jgi:hypothetical protein
MATNNNGNLLDDSGNVAVDFVWGNFPIQPNDERPDAASATLSTTVSTRVAGRLDPEADNHIIALSGWGGYPLFTANSAGEDVVGDTTDYVLVPSVLGLTTALATDAMKDASLVPTTATAATNAAGSITDIDRTAGSTTVELTGVGFTAAYPVGTKITVASTGSVDGTWTVTGNTSTNKIRFTSDASTVLTSGTGSIIGVPGTIKTQSRAAGANEVAPGAAVTITPWAAAS